MWNSLLVQVPQKEGGVGKPLSVPQAGSLSPIVAPFTVCMAHPSITYWLREGSCTTEVKALGRWDVPLAEGKSEATEQWYSDEMAVFKILLETIPLMLVAKYKHPALSPSSGQISMLFPNHPSSCSSDATEHSHLSKPRGWWTLPRPLLHLRQGTYRLSHQSLLVIFHHPAVGEPWGPIRSSVHVPLSTKGFFSLCLQLLPFLRGITNAHCQPSNYRFPIIYKMPSLELIYKTGTESQM